MKKKAGGRVGVEEVQLQFSFKIYLAEIFFVEGVNTPDKDLKLGGTPRNPDRNLNTFRRLSEVLSYPGLFLCYI